jgi:hypothetical protein
MKIERLKCALSLASLLVLTVSACGHLGPDARVLPGSGNEATVRGGATLDSTGPLGQDGTAPIGQAARPSEARMKELMSRLQPEYEERLQRDGKSSADQWLKETAFELGRRDGQAARQGR